jgi:hypothetical protein
MNSMNQNGFTNSLVIGIIALGVLVLGISGYLIFVKKPERVVENPTPTPTPISTPTPTPTPMFTPASKPISTPTPTQTPKPTTIGGGGFLGPVSIPPNPDLIRRIPDPPGPDDWQIYANHLGYKLRYPADKVKFVCQESPLVVHDIPPEYCYGPTIMKIGAEYSEARIPPGYNTDIMVIAGGLKNPEQLAPKQWYKKEYSSLLSNPDYKILEEKELVIGGKPTYYFMSSMVQRWNARGEMLPEPVVTKTKTWIIAIEDNSLLIVSIGANYSDGMTQVYEDILSTLTFAP